MLWEHGTAGIEVRPAEADRLELLAYFPAERPSLEELRSALGAFPGLAVEPAEVPQVDWVARFRDGFRAFRVGGFVVVPEWEPPPPEPPRVLRVDPGRAFGTGTHETTRLCLLALEELAGEAELGRVLDLGAGTGILAVAAARLGARSVTASDCDPEAVAAARAHARLNGTPLHLLQADGGRGLRPAAFDVVLANLTAPLLRERRDEIAALPAAGGRLILSGFLEQDVEELRRAYAGSQACRVRRDGEWAALVVTRGRP